MATPNPTRRFCPRCGVHRRALLTDPERCFYCGTPLDPAPEPVEREPAAPSLFEILEAPMPGVRRAGGAS